MESVIPNMEKADEVYKVPNLEKGIAVLEYLSLKPKGETLQEIKSSLEISLGSDIFMLSFTQTVRLLSPFLTGNCSTT